MQICTTLNIQLFNSTSVAITALFNPTDWISESAAITIGCSFGMFGYLSAICSLVYFAVTFTLTIFLCTFGETLIWLLTANVAFTSCQIYIFLLNIDRLIVKMRLFSLCLTLSRSTKLSVFTITITSYTFVNSPVCFLLSKTVIRKVFSLDCNL